jgi:hypothetical protein
MGKYFIMLLWPFGIDHVTLPDLFGMAITAAIVIACLAALRQWWHVIVWPVKHVALVAGFVMTMIGKCLTAIGSVQPAPVRVKRKIVRKPRISIGGAIFQKVMYHGTDTKEAAMEILNRNLWRVDKPVFRGIHFADCKQAMNYGDYVVEVMVACRQDEVSDYPAGKTILLRLEDDGETFHYFIPADTTEEGQRYRPRIIRPINIYQKREV